MSLPANAASAAAHRRATALISQLTGRDASQIGTHLTAAGGLPGPDPSTQYGGLLAARALQEQGVKWTFTLTGGHIAPILVGCESIGIRVVDVRDEATTVFAADAISRLTGIPGVAIVTAGPGLTNTMTAVKNALLAQSPLVLFAGATAMILKGRGSLQDIDQLSLMRSAVKQSWSITSVRDIIPTIRAAFRKAQEGVPGPVFVEFPIEILWPQEVIAEQIGVKGETAPFSFTKQSILEQIKAFYLRRHIQNVFADGFTPVKPLTDLRVPTLPVPPTAAAKVHRAITSAKAPLMLVGSQAIKAGPQGAGASHVSELVAAIERIGVPVFLSGMARGLLGKQHPLLLRHKRSQILRKADCVLLVGVPADFRLDYGSHIPARATFFTVNLCGATLAKNNDIRAPDMKVRADPLEFVKMMATFSPALVAAASAASSSAAVAISPQSKNVDWFKFIQKEQDGREKEIDKMAQKELSKAPVLDAEGKGFINPLRLCRILDETLPENTRIVADGGDFVGTASYTVKPRKALSWLDPGVFVSSTFAHFAHSSLSVLFSFLRCLFLFPLSRGFCHCSRSHLSDASFLHAYTNRLVQIA